MAIGRRRMKYKVGDKVIVRTPDWEYGKIWKVTIEKIIRYKDDDGHDISLKVFILRYPDNSTMRLDSLSFCNALRRARGQRNIPIPRMRRGRRK